MCHQLDTENLNHPKLLKKRKTNTALLRKVASYKSIQYLYNMLYAVTIGASINMFLHQSLFTTVYNKACIFIPMSAHLCPGMCVSLHRPAAAVWQWLSALDS